MPRPNNLWLKQQSLKVKNVFQLKKYAAMTIFLEDGLRTSYIWVKKLRKSPPEIESNLRPLKRDDSVELENSKQQLIKVLLKNTDIFKTCYLKT